MSHFIPPGHINLHAAVEQIVTAWHSEELRATELTDEEKNLPLAIGLQSKQPKFRIPRESAQKKREQKQSIHAEVWKIIRGHLFMGHLPAHIITDDGSMMQASREFWATDSAKFVPSNVPAVRPRGAHPLWTTPTGRPCIGKRDLEIMIERGPSYEGEQAPKIAVGLIQPPPIPTDGLAEVPQKSKGGRKPKPTWQDIAAEAVRFAHYKGVPDGPEAYIDHLVAWHESELGAPIARSTVQPLVQKIIEAIKVPYPDDEKAPRRGR